MNMKHQDIIKRISELEAEYDNIEATKEIDVLESLLDEHLEEVETLQDNLTGMIKELESINDRISNTVKTLNEKGCLENYRGSLYSSVDRRRVDIDYSYKALYKVIPNLTSVLNKFIKPQREAIKSFDEACNIYEEFEKMKDR